MHLYKKLLICLFSILKITSSLATISPEFSSFLTLKYGSSVEKLLARRDLGPIGSFGGGRHHPGQRTARRPILFVHGLSTVSGEYETLRQYFQINGYAESELYSSSYAFGKLNWTRDSMECGHVKRLRLMIEAISEYTDSQVDVIGYSMGSPLARKAILGGECVDTGEHLGPPMTPLVHTFLGVAGANREAVFLCKLFGREHGPCNNVSGMSCHSRFLDDINYYNGMRYEATKRIYTIYSTIDEIVGYKDCDGLLVSSIPGQDFGLKLTAHTHFTAIFLTFKEQLDLISGEFEPKLNVTITWAPTMPFK